MENGSKIIGIYGGGFKPPTKGHFEVVQQALKQFPEMDELLIYVGSGERDKVDQAESVLVWNIYKKHLPSKVSVESVKAPIGDIFKYAKDHPEEKIYFILGAREGNEDDQTDITSRTKSVKEKYPNIEVKIITTPDSGISGTNARKALFQSRDEFFKYIPSVLSPVEKERVYTLLVPELISENASYAKDIDYKQYIKELTKDMIRKGMNVTPLPKVIFKHSDINNAKDFFGKTAYYEPQSMSIILYTEGRHPKDIVRSFAHEMIHHMQNIEDRLGDITTTNTQEDDRLNDLEAEANLKGTMTFRNWTDSLQEIKYNYSPTLTSLLSSQLYEMKVNEIKLNPKNAVETYGDINNGDFTVGDYDYNYRIINMENNPYNSNSFYNIDFIEIGNSNPDPNLPTGNAKENYIKILSTMYKIILDFIENVKPEYMGISSLDNSGYWNIYNNLIKSNPLSGYSRKDAGLSFTNRNGQSGKFIILKRNNIPESKSKDPFGITAYALELARGLEEQEGSKYKIYVDMDGVLVDFDGGYEKLTGMTTRAADEKGPEFFWKPISKAGAKWWITLNWMPDGKQLWDYVKKYNPELLSAPSREEASKMGKRIWVKRELPGVKLILRSADKKQEFASPNSILIDDREKNIEQWKSAGGVGILHTDAASTIKKLKELGL